MIEDIHSCSRFCARTACVSAREAMTATRIAELRGQRAVMADILDAAAAVIATMDHPESADEAQRLGVLLDQMQDAVRAVRMDGVDIDAAHHEHMPRVNC